MNSFKNKILRYESLPSTNNEVARLAAQGAAEGLAVIAEEQTAGRGRLQRTWVSPKGAGLYFSILLRPRIPQERWPLITFMAALAVNDALWNACQIQTDIKWPNDLLASERKICGILAEVIDTELGRSVVLGIGINLTSEAFPEEVARVAISAAEAGGRRIDPEKVLGALSQALSTWYELIHEVDGPERILAAWISRSSYSAGKSISVKNGVDTLAGVTRGLESDGALRVETASGEIVVVRAGDVSIRMSEKL